jgi:hypothetical protein
MAAFGMGMRVACIFKRILYLCIVKEKNTYSAEYIKSQLIDFLILNCSNDLFIGNEVMYGTKRKLIDLLVLKDNQLTAIEIKADNDDMRRIQEQINESKKIFDFIIVCTTMGHLEKAKELLSNDIGLYSVVGQDIKIIRKPKKQKKLDKQEMLFSINANFLRRSLNSAASKINSDEVRQYYFKDSINKIHNLFTEYLQQKVQSKFNLFLQNRGEYTHIDDIPLLSSSLYIQ